MAQVLVRLPRSYRLGVFLAAVLALPGLVPGFTPGAVGLAAAQGAPAAAVDPMLAGRDLMASGDASAAVQRFEEAVRLSPNDPVALNNLATARAAAGDYSSALGLLRQALGLAPGRVDIQANYDILQAWMASRSRVVLDSPNEDAAPLPDDAASAVVPPLWSGAMSAVMGRGIDTGLSASGPSGDTLPPLKALQARVGGDTASVEQAVNGRSGGVPLR